MTRSSEIVDTAAQAAEMSMPPLFVVEEVRRFLDGHALGRGALEVRRIGEGQSNVTFRVLREGADLVLRRGPRPPLPKSTHDMLREARVQQALATQGFPVPRIRAVCEDEGLLGVPFYVMEHIEGDVITDELPLRFVEADADRRRLSSSLVETLVQLHDIDVGDPSVSALGRPEGYLERQVRRFAGLWPVNTRREIPLVEELSRWLWDNLPPTQRHAVIHGDYRMGNVMYAPSETPSEAGEVLAVLDWEMATLGDPLADLGYLTATYAQPGESSTVLELTSVTRMEGFHSRAELVEAYAQNSDLQLDALPWYQTMALWKAAIFCEAMYTRWLNGERPGDTFAEQLEEGVPQLLERAREHSAQMPRGLKIKETQI